MTYQSAVGICIPPRFYGQNSTAFSTGASVLMDADGEGAGGLFMSPVTDTLTKVGFFVGSVTTGDTLEVRVETVGADGLPTGTLFGTNTSGSQVVAGTGDDTFYEVTLTDGVAMNRGDLFAVIITRPTGGTFNGRIHGGPNVSFTGLPYFIQKTSASWSGSTGTGPNMSLYYQTAGYAPFEGALAMSTQSNGFVTTFSNTSTPDVIGNVINLPFDCKVSGAWFTADLDGDYAIKLYDSDGVTVLGSITGTANVPPATTTFTNCAHFSSDITLSSNTNYRLAIEPSSGTNIGFYSAQFSSAGIKGQCPFFEFASKTTAKDPSGVGSWTDDGTAGALIGLVLSEIDIPAAGGTTGIARLTGGGLVK